ncbi:MAG: DHH family phosphoesterase, partial [Gammaproteobacteria bacterium]|nr:DHH family phosphoesterase [Gammaproteobacteria bacterium]
MRRRAVPEQLYLALPASLDPVLRRVYAARQVQPAELASSLSGLLPVSSLGGVEQAAEVLVDAHRRRIAILVAGDYDADGATATALLVGVLRAMGFARVDYLVPNRFEFGYGFSPAVAELAATRRPGLVVTVDNGISSLEGVARAAALGIDVLVTDHHLPGPELPAARAIVNPNLVAEAFESKALCGVGVAFYLVAALARALDRAG